MAEPEIRLLGFEELADGSRDLFGKVGESSSEAFQGVAEHARDVVAGRVPRSSGALAASAVADRDEGRPFVGIGDEETPYAGWIEFGGTREGGRNSWAERDYIPGGRYLYPVAFSSEPLLKHEGVRATNKEIGRYRWKRPK